VWVWGVVGVGLLVGVGVWGVVSPCVRTFQGLHSVRLWTPTIFISKLSTLQLSRSLVLKELPVRPELPPAVVYFSLFGTNPAFLSRSLDYIAMMKHEMIPMCHRKMKIFEEEKDTLGKAVAESQSENLEVLNAVTKDALAVLATEKVQLFTHL
jgi:hypothetical protein